MIECRDIRKTYQNEGGDTEVLRGISFAITDGEFVSIMGPSGSGKSTLMHILGALDSPSSGGYFLDGQDMSKRSDDELARLRREKIGFVFQAFNLLPRTSVVRNVMLPLIYQEAPVEDRMKQVEASLLAVGLDREHWTHQSNQLSGGQMQRVAIARALVNNPSLILADEPTGNLDTKTGELVLQTFERLNREHGHTIILITHEADVARHADRTLLIRDGLLVSDIQNTPRKK
jgi:putative ABC transport system ATP-binding protein